MINLKKNYNSILFERSYEEIIRQTFTNKDERETKETIELRLKKIVEPETHLILDGCNWKNPEESKINGIIIVEYYKKSKIGLITYLAVKPEARKKGIGTKLFKEAKKLIKCYDSNSFLLAEIHNPEIIDKESDAMNPYDRLKFFESLGGKILPITYVQPALSDDTKKVYSLLLLSFCKVLSSKEFQRILIFLEEFYSSLGIKNFNEDEDFQKIKNQLKIFTSFLS